MSEETKMSSITSRTRQDTECVGVEVRGLAYHAGCAPKGPIQGTIARGDAGDELCAKCGGELA